jgi:hypothetical protein
MKLPKIVLLIFVSGKIVITGAKMREETYTAFENIYPVLRETNLIPRERTQRAILKIKTLSFIYNPNLQISFPL